MCDFSNKISGHEGVAWVQAVLVAKGIDIELTEVQDLIIQHRPTDLKPPRKPRTTKTSSTASDRSEQEYDESRCNARVWLTGGFSAQCSCMWSCEHVGLCKRHKPEADKNDEL